MHKNILWLIFAILCIYFSLVSCEDFQSMQGSSYSLKSVTTALQEEARTKKLHPFHLHSIWGFYGLAIAYLIKVKVFVVAFFFGSAVYFGLRYLWPHKCYGGEIYKEGSIILDHPPSFGHHDHVPYSLDHDHDYQNHHYDSGAFTSSGPSSFDPYSAYSGPTISDTDNSYPGGSFTAADGSSDILHSHASTIRRKRSEPTDLKPDTGLWDNLSRQMVKQEEQIGDFMLDFLGLDTIPCRRRFICEMEYKSKKNSLTAMAFRLIGRNFFAKYTNNRNPLRKANSFEECAAVNAECVFIENNQETEETGIGQPQPPDSKEQIVTNQINEEPVTEVESSLANNDAGEQTHEINLSRELNTSLRGRLRGDRHLRLI